MKKLLLLITLYTNAHQYNDEIWTFENDQRTVQGKMADDLWNNELALTTIINKAVQLNGINLQNYLSSVSDQLKRIRNLNDVIRTTPELLASESARDDHRNIYYHLEYIDNLKKNY